MQTHPIIWNTTMDESSTFENIIQPTESIKSIRATRQVETLLSITFQVEQTSMLEHSQLNEQVEKLNKKLEKFSFTADKFIILQQFAFTFERAFNNRIGNTKCTPFNTLMQKHKIPSDFITQLTRHYSAADIFEFRDLLEELKQVGRHGTHTTHSWQTIEREEFMRILDEFYLTLSNYSQDDFEPYIEFMIDYIKGTH